MMRGGFIAIGTIMVLTAAPADAATRFASPGGSGPSGTEVAPAGSATDQIGAPAFVNAAGGAHTFEVTATDAAGNADPTPASAAFKVKVVKSRR